MGVSSTGGPASGGSIKQIIRGSGAVSQTATPVDYQDFTIPTVNIAKSEVATLGGGQYAVYDGVNYQYVTVPGIELVNSTTLRVHTSNANISSTNTRMGSATFYYQITEWN